MVVFLRLRVSNSYVLGLLYLHLGVSGSYAWGLIFIRWLVSNSITETRPFKNVDRENANK